METWSIDSVRLGVLLSTASTDTVCLNSRGITLQAESRKEYEEVKILSKCYHSCMNVSAKCSAFIFCLLVDLCHQQHLQTDLSHRQSRGGRLLPFFSPFLTICFTVVHYVTMHPMLLCSVLFS